MKQLLIIFSVMSSFALSAQIDTTVTLVAKIDFMPQYQLHDNNEVLLMGYTQSIGGPIGLPSPTLEFTEGDSVQLNMWNLSQGPPHTIHLHGVDVDQQNDGVPMLSFAVAHDDTGSYYFKAPHPGTYLYHCHETSVLHVQAGMYGVLIVRPQTADTLTWDGGYGFHSERSWLMSEIDTNWHHDTIINHDYDPMAMMHPILDYKPQHFLINGKSEQQLFPSESLTASVGEVVYLRLANMGYYGNRVVFPSELNAKAVSSDGRPLPVEYISDTIEVLPGERYGVLIESNTQFLDQIDIEYFNLNTQEVENTQMLGVSINGFVGLPNLSEQGSIIYPNPSSGEFSIAGIQTGKVIIYNSLGQKVKQLKIVNGAVDVLGLKDGMYMLQIEGENEQLIEKLIVRNK
jgi:FtsP/CotA-like multicopper oxidase with cupredoxin domain